MEALTHYNNKYANLLSLTTLAYGFSYTTAMEFLSNNHLDKQYLIDLCKDLELTFAVTYQFDYEADVDALLCQANQMVNLCLPIDQQEVNDTRRDLVAAKDRLSELDYMRLTKELDTASMVGDLSRIYDALEAKH